MVPLDWSIAPSADDMWVDKLEIAVTGYVSWPETVSFADYICEIAESRHLTQSATLGRKYRSTINFGTVIGKVTISLTGNARADDKCAGRARVALSLFLNPTKTRALVVRRNQGDPANLSLRCFFAPRPTVSEAFNEEGIDLTAHASLDQTDNYFRDAHEAGGTTAAARASARDSFLNLFEDRVRELTALLLTPNPRPPVAPPDYLGDARTDVRLVLDWGAASLRNVEVYVERHSPAALSVMKRIYDRGPTLARAVRYTLYSKGSAKFGRHLGQDYPHVLTPLTGSENIGLSIYAKTPDRVRFEVRYRSE